jgi:glyoxylase I family protein
MGPDRFHTLVTNDQLQLSVRSTMERVSGIGGLFFRAQNPEAIGRWYKERLGIDFPPSSYDETPWHQEAGPTAFAAFAETTAYFGDAKQTWMINFRVRDLEAMTAQLRSEGIDVEVDPEQYPNGRFARLSDPEGNPIQLWEPNGRDASRRAALRAR